MAERRELKISVRNLVEFIFREGDINSTGLGTRNPEAMQLGNRIHKKIQKSMGIGYQAEVPLFTYAALQSEETGEEFDLKIEGRADGIFRDDTEILVDEIKGVFMDIHQLKEPLYHRAGDVLSSGERGDPPFSGNLPKRRDPRVVSGSDRLIYSLGEIRI